MEYEEDYEVEYVSTGSQHPLSQYVEEEEELFVIQHTEHGINWWKAEDFFYVKGEMNFKEI